MGREGSYRLRKWNKQQRRPQQQRTHPGAWKPKWTVGKRSKRGQSGPCLAQHLSRECGVSGGGSGFDGQGGSKEFLGLAGLVDVSSRPRKSAAAGHHVAAYLPRPDAKCDRWKRQSPHWSDGKQQSGSRPDECQATDQLGEPFAASASVVEHNPASNEPSDSVSCGWFQALSLFKRTRPIAQGLPAHAQP